MEGWRVASKRLGALSRMRWAALGRGRGREGRVVLPLPRAAVISAGSRVHACPAAVESRVAGVGDAAHQSSEDGGGHEAERGLHLAENEQAHEDGECGGAHHHEAELERAKAEKEVQVERLASER